MSPWLSHAVLALYYSVLGILSLYGVHRLVLVALYYRARGGRPAAPPPPAVWPAVTVQLPLSNEMYVAERLLRAVARLDYPRELLEVQVLDDSTDETAGVVARMVNELGTAGLDVIHLRRVERTGYKAGALAAGLERARGELLAVFDADFVPPPDFLRRTVPHFADPAVGMVQARWGHLNRGYSQLTRVQAILLDGHFLVEHAAREGSGCFFNFNGTAGVWRREAILAAGGWEHDTLTEDLDLSYRAQLAGWKFVFLPEVEVPAELPVEVNAFKRQQFRWAKGSIQTARKLLARVLRAPLPWRVKLEALVHLSNNASYFLMVLLSLLLFPAMLLRRGEEVQKLVAIDLPLFAAATLSVLAFYMVGQVSGRRANALYALRHLPSLMALGIGLAVNNARAVVEGWRERGGVFERTPKYRIEGEGDTWARKRYRARRNSSALVEGIFALYFVLCLACAVALEMWLSLPFLYLFLQGYLAIFLLAVRSARAGSAAPGAAAGRFRGAAIDGSTAAVLHR